MVPELTDPAFLLGLIIAAAILAGGAALYLMKKRISGRTPGTMPEDKASRLAYQPPPAPVSPVQVKSRPAPAVKKAADTPHQPKEISLLHGRSDITDSLRALAEKYSLSMFTIATSDGLVFASNGAESAQDDAARYSEIFVADPLCETPGVVLSGLSYKGSDLILIIGTTQPLSLEIQQKIENDTKDILNWWI